MAGILVCARIMGELSSRFKIPLVIGEITAGILLGPSLLGFVEPVWMIVVLAEIGVILPFGVALRADPKFSEHAHDQMKPVIQLITPIFFVTVGLSLDLSSLEWGSLFFWVFSISLGAVAILSKIVGAMFINERFARRVLIGMSMVPRGEVGLVFAELGRLTGLLNNEIHATVVIVIAYTTLFTPFWLRLFYRYYGRLLDD